MFILKKRFYRRHGDNASNRYSFEDFTLSDGTRFTITVELTFYPQDKKKVSWYLGVGSRDKSGKWASESVYGKQVSNKDIRRLYMRIHALKDTLASHPAKVRTRMLKVMLSSFQRATE